MGMHLIFVEIIFKQYILLFFPKYTTKTQILARGSPPHHVLIFKFKNSIIYKYILLRIRIFFILLLIWWASDVFDFTAAFIGSITK